MTPLEINKKIAELKGFTEFKQSKHSNGLWCSKTILEIDGKFNDGDYFNWAEHISSSWELFEEMSESFSIQKDGLQWMVWKRKTNGTIRFTDSVDTAPMAICLAWLRRKSEPMNFKDIVTMS